ncbi:hypothetical protein N8I74_14455 [Chitiniphilus purpureus]|uniref:Uncharacterized protein n=1 Tax=Chitiniphilus purpureus TaxID=2981137 RepID=A0ABY6DJI7_9NEIS|nr:hypothetical protein [Chitiniphilus sp. CD1]UXY14510.1 hypothetical protein N8I74_14455 [Chitiniphilus sp. CD1]
MDVLAPPTRPALPYSEHLLQAALSLALASLQAHELALAQAELGEIGLPDAAPGRGELTQLDPLAPLYLAHELERAGLLATAEKVAGLFASGAVAPPPGEAATALHRFWRTRRERLNETERRALFGQVFEAQVFYPRMQRLCEAILALADNGDTMDVREDVGLRLAVRALRELLFTRLGGMVAFTARDVLDTVREAALFLRDPALLQAFSVRSLWGLLAVGGERSEHEARQYAELGAAGIELLRWLARPDAGDGGPQAGQAAVRPLFGAAQRWLMAWGSLPASS